MSKMQYVAFFWCFNSHGTCDSAMACGLQSVYQACDHAFHPDGLTLPAPAPPWRASSSLSALRCAELSRNSECVCPSVQSCLSLKILYCIANASNSSAKPSRRSRGLPTNQRRDKTLYVASQTQHKMQSALLRDVKIRQCSSEPACPSAFGQRSAYHLAAATQRAFILKVLTRQCSCKLNLRSCEDQTLLVWRKTFVVPDQG